MPQATNEFPLSFDFFQLPIGVYFVAPDGRFIACNRPVRELLGLPLEGPLEGNLTSLYKDPALRPQLIAKTLEAEQQGRSLEKELIALCVNGHDIYVQDYCRPLRDPASGELDGFVGCMVNVTPGYELEQKKAELQQKVEELVIDIGRVLHANTSLLVMAEQTLIGVAEVLGVGSLQEFSVPALEEEDEQLVRQAGRVAEAIDQLLQKADPEQRLKALPAYQWELLANQPANLRQIREVVPVIEMRLPTLRKLAHEVVRLGHQVKPGNLPRELVRNVLQEAENLERMATLYDALKTRDAIIQMDLTLRSLRDYITSGMRQSEIPVRLQVHELVEQAVMHLAEFAKSSRVEIAWRNREVAAEVMGVERELVRALSNLLHNAIKYSWRRDRSKPPWVKISTLVREGNVYIEFENWGVPVEREELESQLVFQLGYRGRWSRDRGRLGTGIGLTDARRVAEAHDGKLVMDSKPAYRSHLPEDEEYYSQPFITTVTVCLPLAP